MNEDIHYNISLFDYDRNKLCDLYDSQAQLDGQAFGIEFTRPMDGLNTLTFSIPYNDGDNFRWAYLKNEYQVRLMRGNKKYWFIANQPSKSKSGGEIIGTVECESLANVLKTKNIYLEFDDENGIGTIDELLERALVNTGWQLGWVDPIYEADGVTEKIRTVQSSGKDGALELVSTICNLFRCRPEYDTDTMTLNVYSMNNRNQVTEAEVGKNLDTLSVSYESKDIITRLYVEGEYGDYGYVGIDDVNPTGLSYLLNFDYYKELGMWKPSHQTALNNYLRDISAIKHQISDNQAAMTEIEDEINRLIGQCKLSLYYTSSGFSVPAYAYGSPTDPEKELGIYDKVVVLNSSGMHRYETIATTAAALIEEGDYGIVKFANNSAGVIGGKEVQIEAKKKEIDNLQDKITGTTRADSIAEYKKEIALLRAEIEILTYGPRATMKNGIAQLFIPDDYNGNVDLKNRYIVPQSAFTTAGWEFDGDYGTLFSQTYSAGTAEEYNFPYQRNIVFDMTPVKADGTVMSHDDFDAYVYEIATYAYEHNTTIMAADRLGLVLRVTNVPNDKELEDAYEDEGDWCEALHNLQMEWDQFRARCGWFGDSSYDPTGIYDDIEGIYAEGGVCADYDTLMQPNGLIQQLDELNATYVTLSASQNAIEADFIIAMGNLLRDGYWANNNYIPGQEESLYADALDVMKQMSRPKIAYEVSYLKTNDGFGIPFSELEINDIVRVYDVEMNVHDNLYIQTITEGVDNKDAGSLEISNEEISITGGSISELLGRMSQLADLIEQKNALYERAKAISKNGTLYADRLNGQIDVIKNQILSTVSNWYTDENGNIVFLSADGGSAMMLSGAGFMIASSKNDDGDWNWRTFGTGNGFTADLIVAGFISSDRIEAGSIATSKLEPDAGNKLSITNNPEVLGIKAQIDLLPDQIVSYVGSKGFGKTYVQINDPATEIDPETGELKNEVKEGDYWFIPPKDSALWDDFKDNTWADYYNTTWGLEHGKGVMYVRHNNEWVEIYNQADTLEVYTQIKQTTDEVRLEAVRASKMEGRLEASITLTAREIRMDVDGLNSKTRYLQDDGKILLEAFTTTTAQNIATRAGITLDANGSILLSAAHFDSLGNSSSGILITPTSIDINTDGAFSVKSGGAINIQGGTMNVTSSSAINVEASTIKIKSNGLLSIEGGKVEIKQNGQFVLTSTNLNIDNTGKITSCSNPVISYPTITNGDVSGKIKAQELYISNQKASLTLDNQGHFTVSSLTTDAQNSINKASKIVLDGNKISISSMTTDVQGAVQKAANIEVDSSGKIKLEALENNVQTNLNKASKITLSGNKIDISSLTTDAQGAIQKAASITVDSNGKITLSALENGVQTNLNKASKIILSGDKIALSSMTTDVQGAVQKAANITVDSNGKIVLSSLENNVQTNLNKASKITLDGDKIALSSMTTGVQNAVNKAANIDVDSSGKIVLNAMTSDVKGAIQKAAGITVDSSGKIELSALSSGVQGNLTKAAAITLDSNGKIDISCTNLDISGMVTIGDVQSEIASATAGMYVAGNSLTINGVLDASTGIFNSCTAGSLYVGGNYVNMHTISVDGESVTVLCI